MKSREGKEAMRKAKQGLTVLPWLQPLPHTPAPLMLPLPSSSSESDPHPGCQRLVMREM